MRLTVSSPAKVNLFLRILGKRTDGFHELETVMAPLTLADTLDFSLAQEKGIHFTCFPSSLKADPSNLVIRAATVFFEAAGIEPAIRIHLEKRIPLGAGLGGGSSNAAKTLLALNRLFLGSLDDSTLYELAMGLGSDVPFFLQNRPALAKGRGEIIQPLEFFPALSASTVLLLHPGFGISTPWAYQQFARFQPRGSQEPGQAEEFITCLAAGDFAQIQKKMTNSLEPPVFQKYPILPLIKEFFQAHGALACMMSGSGSTVFAICDDRARAEKIRESFYAAFGHRYWIALAALEKMAEE